jgi:CheY-like chemotaxis protein
MAIAFTRGSVLVVDDDPRNIHALSVLLTEKGFEVHGVESGELGIEYLERGEEADVVLMDIMMPNMDGYEAIRRIRQNPKLKSLPVVALTAKAMPGDKERCVEAGASDYITKPIDSEYLVSRLKRWIATRQQQSVARA